MIPAVYEPNEDTSISKVYVTHPDCAMMSVRGDVQGKTEVVMTLVAGADIQKLIHPGICYWPHNDSYRNPAGQASSGTCAGYWTIWQIVVPCLAKSNFS